METKGVVCKESEDNIMLVQWKKDADAVLAEAKASKKSVLVDFSAAPA